MKTRHRLLLVLLLTAVFTSLIIGLASVRFMTEEGHSRLVERIRAETSLLAGWVLDAPADRSFQDLAQEAGRRLGARVTLIAGDGTVTGDSARDDRGLREMDNHLDRPEVRVATTRGFGESLRRSATTSEVYLYSARRVPGDHPVGYVRVAVPAYELRDIRSEAFWITTGIILVALGVVAVMAYILVRRVSRPLEIMADAAERAAAGEFELDVPSGREDELGRLARSVNRMRKNLLAKIDELEDERHLLGSVVGGMREGLLLLGPDRRVRLANDAFRQSVRLPFEPEGHLLAEVIRNPTVLRELDTALQEGREIRETVLHAPDSGRSYELHVTPVESRDAEALRGALVLFFDITRLEALEGVRREFVANVSHELRTPLASIKAFVETVLEDGLIDRENSMRFLEIVQKHADRMEALIDDLTDLSLMETASVQLEIEAVDAHEVARDVTAQLEHKYAGTGARIRIELTPPFHVRADRRRLEQVLVNLLDNAIKFNRKNGRVVIEGSRDESGATLVVRDTGVGIPADSLDRVFNRFYRVDKARSREVGGTGLGLAIVKHIVRLHGGEIRLESELGRGSTFTLFFPAGEESVS